MDTGKFADFMSGNLLGRKHIEHCFPNFFSVEEPPHLNNFSCPQEPLHMKTFRGYEKSIAVSAVQLLLNYLQKHLYVSS